MNTTEYIRNCNNHTLEELAPYFEQHVAWSVDGKTILAHAKDLEELFREMNRLGLNSEEYVAAFIPNPDISTLGGLTDCAISFQELSDGSSCAISEWSDVPTETSDPDHINWPEGGAGN